MHRRVIVLLNAAAGGGWHDAARVRAALEKAGVDAEVREVPGRDLARAAEEAACSWPDAVVAAGGDGTVGAVAGAIAGRGTPMGVLPLGTLNHFARDLGIPPDLDGAARVVAEGVPRAVDVAEVNGRVFVNNASLGLYPEVVLERDAQLRGRGRPRWIATLVAIWRNLRDRLVARRTPFVFVGNNRYEARLTAPGRRTRLDGGELSILMAHASTRWEMLRAALAALLRPGAEPRAPGLDLAIRPEVVVDGPHRELRVALDGEVHRMRPPLRYRVRPRALRVLAPPGGAA
jgi:diacylglycerol kinase family enzyme